MKNNTKNLLIAGLSLLLATYQTTPLMRFLWIIGCVAYVYIWWVVRANERMIKRMIEEAQENAVNLSQVLPPEVKEKLHDTFKLIIENLPKPKKCDDPHCKNCWGLGDKEHQNE